MEAVRMLVRSQDRVRLQSEQWKADYGVFRRFINRRQSNPKADGPPSTKPNAPAIFADIDQATSSGGRKPKETISPTTKPMNKPTTKPRPARSSTIIKEDNVAVTDAASIPAKQQHNARQNFLAMSALSAG